MKLLFLCHGAGNGGAERVITTLATEFAKRKYDVYLVTTKSEKYTYTFADQITFTAIDAKGSNGLTRTLHRISELRRHIRQIHPDCIVSFSAIPNMQAITAKIGLRVKLIISERTDPSKYPTSRIGKFLRKALYPMCDKIVFQTQDAKRYFSRRLQKKGIIIPNPIRDDLPDRFEGIREKRIVGIGSLGDQKHWEVALDAAELFFGKFPEYTFDIYGEGPKREILQQKINSSKLLNNRVFLRGFSNKAVESMNNARMYVSSSDYEGISNSMLEALATGVPTIYTDCPVGGARQFIKNGYNGFLVPVNDPDSLYKSMVLLAENDTVCETVSQNSVEIKKQLKLDEIVNRWEMEILEICGMR